MLISMSLLLVLFSLRGAARTPVPDITIDRTQTVAQKTPVTCVTCGTVNRARELMRLLEFFGHMSVRVVKGEIPNTTEEIRSWFIKDAPLVLFFTENDEGLSWRLYDTYNALMLKGKRYVGDELVSYVIAHDIWSSLTSYESPFEAMIAYVKQTPSARYPHRRTLCTSKIDGGLERNVVSAVKGLVAPHWLKKDDTLALVFSQFTHHNAKIVGTDLAGNRWNIIDLPGTNVGISLSPVNNDILYCHSGTIMQLHYDRATKKSHHTLKIKEQEPVAQPIWRSNGNIIYAGNGVIKEYDTGTGTSKVISSSGYCAGPAYHEGTNRLFYSRRIKGVMQLCVRSLDTQTEEQLTFDAGDKVDVVVSPGGSYLAFCHEQPRGGAQIVALDLGTRKRVTVTQSREVCRYPAWGG